MLTPLSKPPYIRRSILERLPERKSVTIGVGFVCDDGVVLCSDTQMSDGLMKFYENKIYPFSGKRTKGSYQIALTYAGNPNSFKMVKDKFAAAISEPSFDPACAEIRRTLEFTLSDAQSVEGLYILCGAVCENGHAILLKTEGKIVREVDRFEFVGVGDSSVLHYLTKLLLSGMRLKIGVSKTVGVYLVAQAKAFVDDCGGDTTGIALKSNGKLEMWDEAMMYGEEQRGGMLEISIGHLLRAVCDAGKTDADVEYYFRSFEERLKELREWIRHST